MITAVGVVIPAKNEEDLIGDCLRSVHRSLRQLPPALTRMVCVVADRCTDGTERIATAEFGRHVVRNTEPLTIGEVRDLGVRRLLAAVDRPKDEVWLLHTDADSTVPSSWASGHLRHAARGVHAVAGTVELPGQAMLPPAVRRRYADLYSTGLRAERHDHVHGANLGIRADAYLAVGGFPAVATGEDVAIWHRLRAAGYRTACPANLAVHTSARTAGRARGGLADLLRSLGRLETGA